MSVSKSQVGWTAGLIVAAGVTIVLAWSGSQWWVSDHGDKDVAATKSTKTAPGDQSSGSAHQGHGHTQAAGFQPPPRRAMPDGDFGKMVKLGENVFRHTQQYAGQYVGNDLSCANCHLDSGRKADSAPLWAAWTAYPKYRGKNDKVNDYAERLQGCFQYSMNGTPPPRGSDELVALEAYSFWLAKNAPTGKSLPGGGYPDVDKPPKTPSYKRGKQVFAHNCALCHGDDGQGQRSPNGEVAFPPLWGAGSYNWGAGMHRIKTAASFIKANMPLSKPELSLQQAWDVARYIDSHERPQDPRFTGSVKETQKKFHGTPNSMYGTRVNGRVLGRNSPPADAASQSANGEGHEQ